MFKLESKYIPSGDQPEAINKLVEIIKKYQNNEYIPRSSQDIHIGKQYKTEDRNIKTAIIYYIKQIKRMLKK